MKLPDREKAYVPSAKLRDYLLSERHFVGRSKAKFFRLAGFSEANVEVLERGLITIAQSEDVTEVSSSPHGTKYVVDGSLTTPSKGTVQIRTVWIVEAEEEAPRFVTSYPL